MESFSYFPMRALDHCGVSDPRAPRHAAHMLTVVMLLGVASCGTDERGGATPPLGDDPGLTPGADADDDDDDGDDPSGDDDDLPGGDDDDAPSPDDDDDDDDDDDNPVTLPFAADDIYSPSGWMGDGEADDGSLNMTPAHSADTETCDDDRAHAAAVGNCHIVTYTPGASNWAGIQWQYPLDNWGAKPGRLLAPGATKVTFYAKGGAGGEKITVIVAGLAGTDTSGTALPHQDPWKVELAVTLTATWTEYSLDLGGKAYTRILGGFAWTSSGADNSSLHTFYLDDIKWQ